MLTVKHVGPHGEEEIQEYERVYKTQAPNALTSEDYQIVCHKEGVDVANYPVFEGYPDGVHVYDSGTVYVMNRYGKTVEVYRMGNRIPTFIGAAGNTLGKSVGIGDTTTMGAYQAINRN